MKLIVTLLHVVVCFALILIVLLQKGKGAGMGAAFGGSSQTVFGSGGASPFLTKATTVAAVIFMLTSLSLSFYFGHGTAPSSIMENVQQTEAPSAAPDKTNAPPPAATPAANSAPAPAEQAQDGQK